MRHRDSHLDIIGHDFTPNKRHRVLALQDEPRCVRALLKENAMDTNTLLLIVIVYSCLAAAIMAGGAGSNFSRAGNSRQPQRKTHGRAEANGNTARDARACRA